MRTWPRCLASGFLLGTIIVGLSPSRADSPRPGRGAAIWLAYQTHFHGQLLPLPEHGAGEPGWGGVPRRAVCVDSLRDAGLPLLLVDGGNFFAAENRATDIISVVTWKEMHRLKYDAVVLGQRELENWFLVKYLLAENPLPLVTTNLEWKQGNDWNPVGVSHLIVDRGGLRIGVLGLIAEADVREWIFRAAEDSLRLIPAATAAKKACAVLEPQVDLVVALIASRSDQYDPLADEVPGIDVFISGRGLCRIRGTPLEKAETRGQMLGLVRLAISPESALVTHQSRNVALTAAVASDPELERSARWVMDQSRQLEEEIRQSRRDRHRSRRD